MMREHLTSPLGLVLYLQFEFWRQTTSVVNLFNNVGKE